MVVSANEAKKGAIWYTPSCRCSQKGPYFLKTTIRLAKSRRAKRATKRRKGRKVARRGMDVARRLSNLRYVMWVTSLRLLLAVKVVFLRTMRVAGPVVLKCHHLDSDLFIGMATTILVSITVTVLLSLLRQDSCSSLVRGLSLRITTGDSKGCARIMGFAPFVQLIEHQQLGEDYFRGLGIKKRSTAVSTSCP